MPDLKRDLLNGTDTTHIHGALLALTELATAFRDAANNKDLEPRRQEVSLPSLLLCNNLTPS